MENCFMKRKITINLWDKIEYLSLNFQSNLDDEYKKANGIYYTGFELAYKIISDLFLKGSIQEPVYRNTFLEPCGGIGNFVFAYLKFIYMNYSLDKSEALSLFKNIYYCEQDIEAKKIYIDIIIKIAKIYFDLDISVNDLNIGGAIIFDLNNDNMNYLDIKKYFDINKFDIIVTNPPYKNLRAEKKHYSSEERFLVDKIKYDKIKNNAKNRYSLSTNAGANIFKYFIEEILLNYSHDNTQVALLIPSSILTDKSCEKLRMEIIKNNGLKKVFNIPENNKYINAHQSLTYLIVDKGSHTEIVDMINYEEYLSKVDITKLSNSNNGYSIIFLKEDEYDLLYKMMKFKKLKELDFIVNMRGELDLTLNKSSITNEISKFKLVKGRNINKYKLLECDNGYIKDSFVNASSKKSYITNDRIACQQIANLNKKNRLVFSYIPKNYVLGNSCNFIYVRENEKYEHIDLYFF